MPKIKHTQFLHEGIQVVNYDWQYVSVNDVAVMQSGTTHERLIGYKMTEVFPAISTSPLFGILRKCMKDREPTRFENHIINADNSSGWFDLRVQPCKEGICIFSVDITARKENESKLKKANGLYALLTHISQKIVTVKDENELFRDCCSLALRFGDFSMAWIGLFDATLQTLTMVDQSGIAVKELPMFHKALKNTNEQLAYIIQSGNYYISTDIQNEPGLEPWHDYAQQHSIMSCILLPIRKSGQIIGLFSLYSAAADFSEDEIALLQQVTTDISHALDIFEQVRKQQETQKLLLRNEQQFRHTLDHMIEGAQIHDFNWRYTYVNDALVQYSTYAKEELLGHSLMEKYPGIEQTALFATLSHCMNERVSEKMETEFVFPDGSKANFELSIQPVPEGLFILSVDRTEQIKAKEKLLKANRLYAFNSAINQNIVQVDNEQELLDNTCRIAYDIGKFALSWIKLLDNGYLKRVSMAGTDAAISTLMPFISLPADDPALYGTPTDSVLRSGAYAVSNDIMNDTSTMSWRPYVPDCGVRSSICFPIRKLGVTIGVFALHSGVIDFFDEEEIALLQEAADDISFALGNFEKAKIHKATEELIEQNEKRFRALIEKSADIKTLATYSGRLIYGSPAFTKVLGYERETFLNTSLLDYIHPDDVEAFRADRDGIKDVSGATFKFQHRRKHKDNHWLWVEGSVTNLLHEPGVMAMVSNFRDITDKKLLEQQRDYDTRNLNALINNTQDLLWSIDRNYRLITSNQPFDVLMKDIFGKAIAKGDDILQGSASGQVTKFTAYYDRAFAGESFSVIEHNTDPLEFWSEISFNPIHTGHEIIGTACHSRNITERILAEHLLRKSEAFNRGILDSLSAHIAVINSLGTIITVNDSWKQFAGHNCDTTLGNTGEGSNYFVACENAIAAGDKEAKVILPKIKQVLQGSLGVFYHEYPCHSGIDGRWFSMLVRKFESDERLIVISHQDISERKRTENELILNNASLQKTNHELDRFVYSVSHDLRSPLTSVLGIANFIGDESKEPDTLAHIAMIRKSITRLDHFIKNILNYSRNNRTEIEIEHIPLNETINEIVVLLCGAKEYDDIAIEINIAGKYPFYSDKHRFIMIMENLISNAVKYHKSEKSGRFIRVTGQSFHDRVEIRVEDNGTGIALNNHAKIFDMFFRTASTIDGSGIGLYIVRECVQKLVGTIAVDSKEGEGACFIIQLKNLKP